jgi:hypothetical protein
MSTVVSRNIVLFDDDAERIKTWRDKLAAVPDLEGSNVQALDPDTFAKVFEALKTRQSDARATGVDTADDARVLDEADIVIVDFDLTPKTGRADLQGPTLRTLRGSFGDTFAYLTRCYTTAGYTVLVNQTFYQSTFDLTMREFEYSYADLNITDSDLGRQTLWSGRSQPDEFRPWHWPRLLDAGTFVRSLADKIDLDAKVFATLGLDAPDVYELFDPQQLEVLGKTAPTDATFASITGPDSRFGQLSENERPTDEQRRKMAAVALTHWLERIVIPGQNILVDGPHLAQRRPHLVRDPRTVAEFNVLADLSTAATTDPVLDQDALAEARTPAADWTFRPVWLWPRSPRGPLPADELVFCEDVSYFVPIDDATEFNSGLPGPFTRRFVADIDGAASTFPPEYRPQNRFYE